MITSSNNVDRPSTASTVSLSMYWPQTMALF
jgi:hypothetical protein